MPKVTFKVRPKSSAPIIAGLLSLAATVMLAIAYWPAIFYKNTGIVSEASAAKARFFCMVMLVAIAAYTITVALLAKHALAVPAVFALPVFVMFLLDITGVRNSILFFNYEDVLHFYRKGNPFFRGWGVFVILLAFVILLLALRFVRVGFGRAKNAAFAAILSWLATGLWIVFSVFYLFDVDARKIRIEDSGYTSLDFLLSFFYYFAGLLFFISVLIILTAVRKNAAELQAAASEPAVVEEQKPAAMVAHDETAVEYTAPISLPLPVEEPIKEAAVEEQRPPDPNEDVVPSEIETTAVEVLDAAEMAQPSSAMPEEPTTRGLFGRKKKS